MSENLTLNDMSQRVATGRDDKNLVARRIRHWTNEKLIPTEGDTHSGRGRHRLYNREGLLIAAILWELSRYNVPVGVLEQILLKLNDLMDFVMENMEPEITSEILQGRYSMWFAISFDDEKGTFECDYFDKDDFLKQKMENASVIILNIEKIASRVNKP